MKQIYINTHLGTVRVDYNPDLPGDIIIEASNIGHIYGVIQEHIECTNIDSQVTANYIAEPSYVIMPIDELKRRNDCMVPQFETKFVDGENY
tara:strand:- start:3777 stop:4052 length:276 start_codon:yes stop_codon:yes gene_type:complete